MEQSPLINYASYANPMPMEALNALYTHIHPNRLPFQLPGDIQLGNYTSCTKDPACTKGKSQLASRQHCGGQAMETCSKHKHIHSACTHKNSVVEVAQHIHQALSCSFQSNVNALCNPIDQNSRKCVTVIYKNPTILNLSHVYPNVRLAIVASYIPQKLQLLGP